MIDKKGRFIVFEGIDGSGKSTQIGKLAEHIRALNKYQDVLLTREPTYRAQELRGYLDNSKDSFSEAELMARLFTEDRRIHSLRQIMPALDQNSYVLCDRYALSTCAYQSAQGMDFPTLLNLHTDVGIATPDLTFLVDVTKETSDERILNRGAKKEKFEEDPRFKEILITKHKELYNMSLQEGIARNVLGKIVLIDGNREQEKVFEDIKTSFEEYYNVWKAE